MMTINFSVIRLAIAEMDATAAHGASGEDRPQRHEIFAPEQHVGALDPNTTIVLGARGAGKSFWAGVLGNSDTREAAAEAYPNIGLEDLEVKFGFTGLAGDGSVSRATIDQHVQKGEERTKGVVLWRTVLLRALLSVITPGERVKVGSLMSEFSDAEDWEYALEDAEVKLASQNRRLLVIFDALDGLAEDWHRLRDLVDALLEVAWSIRGYRTVRIKLFLRPDQMRDLGLRFVEVPKMLAGATNLVWTSTNLYGILFTRLALMDDDAAVREFKKLLVETSVPMPPDKLSAMRRWRLATNRVVQARVFSRMAGRFMGRSNKKGRTYDWPVNHLSDGHGEVTPRSFLTLILAAANSSPPSHSYQALTAEGIRNGLREASKVRLNQLDTEFKWIKRVLAPLARLQVPCTALMIIERWKETETVDAVMKKALAGEFLPPFDPGAEGSDDIKLISRLVRMGVLTVRNDGRFDMPDLFRVAARLLRKGGVAPS